MSGAVRVLVALLLLAAAWKVHEVRGRLASEGGGPAEAVRRLQASLDALPLDLGGGFVGTPFPLDPDEAFTYGTESYVRRRFQTAAGEDLTLYVAGTTHFHDWFHTPNFCLIAKGWEIREEGAVPFFDVPGVESGASMSRVVTEYGHRRMVVYYWLQAGDTILEAKWGRRLHRFWDLLAGRAPTATTLVVLYVHVRTDFAAAEALAAAFARQALPHLARATAAP